MVLLYLGFFLVYPLYQDPQKLVQPPNPDPFAPVIIGPTSMELARIEVGLGCILLGLMCIVNLFKYGGKNEKILERQ